MAQSEKVGLPARLAGGALLLALAVTPAACFFADALVPGGGAALERLVVASAELLVLCAIFLIPGLAPPRIMDWHPVAVWLTLAWFLLTACTVLNAQVPVVAALRQAEWVLHAIFALMVALYLTVYPRVIRPAIPAAALGLATALGLDMGGGSASMTEWDVAWERLLQSPLIGIGPDQYAYMRAGVDQPGNALLQLALEWGVPGLIVFLLGVGWIVKRGMARRGEGAAARLAGPAMVLGLMTAGLFGGALYHASPLFFFFFGIALCLRIKPVSQEKAGFDRDIHGLVLLSAGLLLAHGLMVKNLILEPAPSADSMTSYIARHVPLVMAWDGAGARMNQWAVAWREESPRAAYELLDWTATHARYPEDSLGLMAQWFEADGFATEARHTRRLLDQLETSRAGP